MQIMRPSSVGTLRRLNRDNRPYTADLYSLTPVRNLDNSSTDNPALEANDVPIRLSEISAELAQTIFGLDPTIVMQGSVPRTSPVEAGMVIEVRTGDFSGRWLKVVKKIEHPFGDSYSLGLADTRALT